MPADVEYVMRVKLPSSSAYSSGPSGDTDYDEAYKKAIRDSLPEGFEVNWSTQHLWPRNQDDVTFVKLKCTNKALAMETWRKEAVDARRELERIYDLLRQALARRS